jgi:Helix-turn-helix domain
MTRRENSARRLLRLRTASEYLSISPAKLREIVQREGLPVIRLAETGHAPWLIDVRDLDTWIERTKTRLE